MSSFGMAGEVLYVQQQIARFRDTGDCRTQAEIAAAQVVGRRSRIAENIARLNLALYQNDFLMSPDASGQRFQDSEEI